MIEQLEVLIGGREVATLQRGARGRWSLRYASSWRHDRSAFPLSLSMPLAAREHGHEILEAWVWNLLPDNTAVLDRWARRFQVSARNPFALVAHVGEDCPGAVQIVRPERVEVLERQEPFQVDWLTDVQVAERLALLERDHAAWRTPQDTGWFSLAGAQPKTALLWHEGRWAVPRGRTPTTHILKPPIPGLDGHVENEHFCLALAREVGLPAASTEVRSFGGHRVIVVERYDRVRTADLVAAAPTEERAESLRELAAVRPILRLHQEDGCQALGLPPTAKYQNEGGPGPEGLAALLRDHSSRPREDLDSLLGALAFSWVIGGTDAHAKNYALLHGAGGRARLAPLYDIASTLPYYPMQKLKLAMKVGGEYRLGFIGARHWERLGEDMGLAADETLERVRTVVERVGECGGVVAVRCQEGGLEVGELSELIEARTTECSRVLSM
jgi:serine/threonine-protein kinase HipA